MAALLPRADQSAKVVPVGTGSWAWRSTDDHQGPQGSNRLPESNMPGVSVFDAKLDDLLPKPSKKIRDGVQGRNSS